MGLRERLLDYIAYKGIDKATLERRSGLSNDAVNKMGDNTRTNTLDIERIPGFKYSLAQNRSWRNDIRERRR